MNSESGVRLSRFLPGGPVWGSSSRRGPVAVALAALLVVTALAGASCSPAATPTAPLFPEVPIGPTPWPNGTTGQYGLHIDPTLLKLLPATVDAYPIVEDPDNEASYLDDPDRAGYFDNLAAAQIGVPSDADWLVLEIAHFKTDAASPSPSASSDGSDPLENWIADYADQACSQASGVASTSQETINFWIVDTAQCAGGPVVYMFPMGTGDVLSMFGFGPLDLGRRLIEALYT